jgi:hypothetical protein
MMAFIKQYFTTVLAALTIMSVAYMIFWVIFGKKLSNRKIQLSKRAEKLAQPFFPLLEVQRLLFFYYH